MAPRRTLPEHVNKPFDVRWTQTDLDANLPERFAAALRLAGAERSSKVRALVRCWTEEIEKVGFDPTVKTSVLRAIQEMSERAKTSLMEPPAPKKKS